MGEFVVKQKVGGTGFHVSDCRIWAEINYLDSATDYREWLPTTRPDRDMAASTRLESSGDLRRPRQISFTFVFCLTCLFLLAVALTLHLSDCW